MIDFNNKPVLKFKAVPIEECESITNEVLIENEKIVACFASMRERLIFTNKRLITLIRIGFSGNKTDFTSIPYRSILAFSIEKHGYDNYAELDIVIKELGKIKFELKGDAEIKNISTISKAIAEHILWFRKRPY